MGVQENVEGVAEVFVALDRLSGRGLTLDDARGLNAAGWQVLSDTAAVTMAQSSSGDGYDQLLAGICRGLLSAQHAVVCDQQGNGDEAKRAKRQAMEALAEALSAARQA